MEYFMNKNNIELISIAKKIKLVAFDVDGVMTDGSLTFLEDGREIKTYNAKDGLGVVMLSKAGLITSIITARENNAVKLRAEMIDIKELYMGQKNKIKALNELVEKYNLDLSEVAYLLDTDLNSIYVQKYTAMKNLKNNLK